jgi:hypothetical protein
MPQDRGDGTMTGRQFRKETTMTTTRAAIGTTTAALILGTAVLAPLDTTNAGGPVAARIKPPTPCLLVTAGIVPPGADFCLDTLTLNEQTPFAPFGGSGADAGTVDSAVTAANEFLALLSDDQRAATVFDFADLDGKSSSWSNFEQSEFDGRQGARFGDLDEEQKDAAMAVLASVLSAGGYEYVEGAMAAEDILIPGNIDEYYLAFYGEPSSDEPWTLQFGGHHLAIHISMGGDILSVSPYFQGVQPITLDIDGTTIEPMANDTNNMFGLFELLDEEQLAAAHLAGTTGDLVMGPQIDTGYPEPTGLPYTELTAEQQALVRAVISDWVDDAAPGLAGPLMDVYESQLDETVIGWSISIDREGAAYMRIDGPRVWIEWLNRANPGEAGFHPHTVYRDKLVDYGTGADLVPDVVEGK